MTTATAMQSILVLDFYLAYNQMPLLLGIDVEWKTMVRLLALHKSQAKLHSLVMCIQQAIKAISSVVPRLRGSFRSKGLHITKFLGAKGCHEGPISIQSELGLWVSGTCEDG
jgi:hypothetical protein